MTRPLPVRPDLTQLRRQAKDLLKAHRLADTNACRALSYLPRLRGKSAEQILSARLCLSEAQNALARTYGFPNWGALKRGVEAIRSAGETRVLRGHGRSYAYVAVDAAQKLHRGVVEARDLDEARVSILDDAIMPIELTRADRSPRRGARQRVREAVELLLYQTAADGVWARAFNCKGPEVLVGLQWEPDSPVTSELRTGLDSSEVLEVLRQRSGASGLGRKAVRRRVAVCLGHCLSDLHPMSIEVEFFCSEDEPRRVHAAMLYPGSASPESVDGDQLLQRILGVPRGKGGMHVLTADEARGQELARELSARLGQSAVGLMTRANKEIPGTPVVVCDAPMACFGYIRACIRGKRERDALERKLADVTAVCVDLSPVTRTPCEIRNTREGLIGARMIGAFLMRYGRVVELTTRR